jgi:Ras-related protein Rab-18
MEDYTYQLKVVLIGDSGVGKSSILLRYTDDRFSDHQPTTIGVDFKTKYETVQGKRLKVALWDTAGQERFRTLTTTYYRGAQGAILVFDVTRQDTFTNLNTWLEQLESADTSRGTVKLLIGNKVDLPNRVVSFEEAELLAKSKGMIYIETSAKTKKGISETFEEMIHKIVDSDSLLETAKMGRISSVTVDFKRKKEEGACGC